MTTSLAYGGVDFRKWVLPAIAITVGVLLIALIGIRYAAAVAPSDYGLKEGDTVSAAGSDDPDVYIVNELGYKRLFLNPAIFGMYGHLGGFANVKSITPATRDAFPTSGLFRNCETNDLKVYGVETTGEDTGVLHWVNTTGAQAVADDANFFKKVFCINTNEFNWYAKSATDYTSVSQVPSYARVAGVTPTPTPGALAVSLASDNPAARTITLNSTGTEFLKVRFSGTGTVNQVTLKRLGAGETNDFSNVYVYDGATRLVSGKTFSSSNGEVTFINLGISVSGTKDISFVADMASTNTAGNVNYIQLKEVVLSSGTVSGLPVNGNNMTSSGASSGTVTVSASGAVGNPNVGQKNVQLTEFKLTTATEAGSVKRITMIQGGSVKPQDITNLKLKTGTNEWSGSMTSKGYAVFDLGSGFTIAKGGNAVFGVYGDVAGKKTETIIFYFESDADTYVIGDQYGQGMAVTDTNFDSSSGSSVKTWTLQGGVLTLNFVGPTAGNIGTDTSDTVFLRYSMTSAANIEVRKTRLVICADHDADASFDTLTASKMEDLEDIKIINEDTSSVIVGPYDATSYANAESTSSCPNSALGLYYTYTDVFDIAAGQTLNLKITGDVKTANAAVTSSHAMGSGDAFRLVLEGYATLTGTSGDVTAMKYSGTTTAVDDSDIAPSTDISGPTMTLQSSSLTLGLAATPGDQTFVKGTKNVDMVGITFAAAQASDLRVTSVTITGYVDEDTEAGTYDEGADATDTSLTIANAVTNVRLYEAESGNLIAGTDKIENNQLSVAGTGTMKFSFTSTPWTIAAGATKTMLVRIDLTNNTVSSTYDYYKFDINATTNVTALDSSNNTVNAGNSGPNGTTTSTGQVLAVASSGTITIAQAPDSPIKAAAYWGQTSVPFSKFRFTSTNEAQYIEKLTVIASVAAEATDAIANVKNVTLTYKNKAGSTLTSAQSFTSGASANFGWSSPVGSGVDLRPYIPKDSNMDISVAADLRIKTEGATQDTGAAGSPNVYLSLDLSDTYSGSTANGIKFVGEGSGTVTAGDGSGIADVLGKNDKYIYRVYPKIDIVALPSPYLLVGTPDVYKFTVTAMGRDDSKLLFDNQDTTNFASGSIKFEVISSGEYTVGGSAYSTSFEVYDSDNVLIDSGYISAQDAKPSFNASLTFDFSSQDVEIAGGGSKTFRIQLTNPGTNYAKTTDTGRAPDYLQIVLRDDENGLIDWVGNSTGSTADLDSTSTSGTLRQLPASGPTWQR